MRNNNMRLYVVYDAKAELCGPVFEAQNDQVAIRAYLQMLRGNDFKQDYELWQVGEIDQGNMQLSLFKQRVDFVYEKPVEVKKNG